MLCDVCAKHSASTYPRSMSVCDKCMHELSEERRTIILYKMRLSRLLAMHDELIGEVANGNVTSENVGEVVDNFKSFKEMIANTDTVWEATRATKKE
jgi:hypothetical protein